MNTHAYKTNFSLYTNSITGKRNSCTAASKKLFKNFKTNRNSSRKTSTGNGHHSSTTVDSIIELFNGTIVTGYTAGIEWGAIEYISLPGN